MDMNAQKKDIILKKDIFSDWGETHFVGAATTNETTIPALQDK
jgi:hypothetical protein